MKFFVFFGLISIITLTLFSTRIFAAISDQDYETLGERVMDQMMGTNHKQADQNIKDTMGEDFLNQMHIAMGKMAEKNANGGAQFGMMPMMSMMMGGGGANMMGNFGGNYGGMMGGGGFGIFALLGGLVWILVIVALVLLIIWLWKQIQKK